MKFTLSWLRDHLETTAPLDAILAALTDLGLEVEEVVNPLDRLRGFTIGLVKSAVQHPDADRLRVCMVETGDGVSQIICGAPNARAGIRVVVAKPGMYVPGIDTTIQVGKIRGIESHGMMCSEREMELSEAHDGIIELPGEPPVGMEFSDWLAENDPARADPMVHVKVTPNRPDALGVRGIARDLAARGLGRLKPEAAVTVPGAFPCPIGVTLAPDVAGLCHVFAGRLVRGVRNGPSPDWLQDRLKAIGLRPISALVDVTNFFTHDRNRPLHVFDADRLAGDLVVRMAHEGERVETLDDKTHTLAPGMMVIADDNGAESIGGIMGGLASGCTDATVNVFVESALWDTISVAATGRALKINSDARYRNERGIDPEWDIPGLEAATRMILELCGGEASDIVVAGAVPDTDRAYRLDPTRVVSLVGLDIPEATQRATLTALGFRLAGDMAHPPSWRPDVQGEADLIEEIARIASLSGLEGKPLPRVAAGVPAPVLTPLQRREQAGRRTAASLGYNECVTYSFIDRAAAALFGGGAEALRVENPISSEMTHMRPDLLPGLLRAAARNQARGFSDLALFEVGPAFHGAEPGEQHLQVAGLLTGRRAPRDPYGSARAVDAHDARADAEAVLAAMGAPDRVQILRGGAGWWHPGRHGRICLGPKKTLGVFGELHPAVLAARGEGTGGRLHALARRDPAAAQRLFHPPGATAFQLSGGRARLRLRGGREGRGAGARQCRRRGRQGTGGRCAGVRRIRGGEGRGADGRGQEVACAHRAAATRRPDADRQGNRGGRGAHRREGDEGNRRRPARLTARLSDTPLCLSNTPGGEGGSAPLASPPSAERRNSVVRLGPPKPRLVPLRAPRELAEAARAGVVLGQRLAVALILGPELLPALEPPLLHLAPVNRRADRAAGLGPMAAIAEPALAGQIRNLAERGVDPLGHIRQPERPHPRRVDDMPARRHRAQRPECGGMPPLRVVLADRGGQVAAPGQRIGQRRLADPRRSQKRHRLPLAAPRKQRSKRGGIAGVHGLDNLAGTKPHGGGAEAVGIVREIGLRQHDHRQAPGLRRERQIALDPALVELGSAGGDDEDRIDIGGDRLRRDMAARRLPDQRRTPFQPAHQRAVADQQPVAHREIRAEGARRRVERHLALLAEGDKSAPVQFREARGRQRGLGRVKLRLEESRPSEGGE